MKKLIIYFLLLLAHPGSLFADGTITAGSGGTYPGLKGAFNFINAGSVTGVITIQIVGSYARNESAILNASGSGSANYSSVTIYPTGSGYTIGGNFAGAVIDLNGASNVTFDGRVNQSGAADLKISNTNTGASASTFRFINSASSNTIKYCIIKGSGTSSSVGVIFFSTASSGSGNSSNTIDNNYITCSADANRPYNALYSSGTSGFENASNTISNNYFHDFFNKGISSNGILISSNSTTWTISGNSFYETASFAPTADVTLNAIQINNTSGNGFVVSGNYIGGQSGSCGGSAWTKTSAFDNIFTAINLNVGIGTASSIQNNTIKNFDWSNSASASWMGIQIAGGNVNIGTVTGNTIGASTGTGSISFTGGDISSNFYGISLEGTGTTDCENNIIGSITVSNSIDEATNFYGINKY